MGKKKEMTAGLRAEIVFVVEEAHTARHVGSGKRDVLSTPALAAFLERAAEEAVAAHLGDGEQTVGVEVQLSHDAATPPGMAVTAVAELVSSSGRLLYFRLAAMDEKETIATGTHTRTRASTASLDRLLQKKMKK